MNEVFPIIRKRRLRRTEAIRSMVRETEITPRHLIAPMFIVPGIGIRAPIVSMPGQYHMSMDTAGDECEELFALGVQSVLLFGIPDRKDAKGSEALRRDGVVQCAIEAIKKRVPDMVIVTDVCVCEYTSHGHCGVLRGNEVDNDATVELLAKMAISHAEAGADIVAPSDMMDGRVAAIRAGLDSSGYTDVAIMACCKIRIGILWPIQGSSPFGSTVWRPAVISDGSGKYQRSYS